MKVLLAEDDPITREIVQDQLTQWGYEVGTAVNGVDAWQALARPDAPQLVILDWKLPGVTGLEICQKVRSRKQGAYIYIIMLTSLSDKQFVVQGLQAGADDYLTKPCNPEELRMRMHAGQRILSLEAELLATLSQLKELTFVDNKGAAPYENLLTGRETEILRLVVEGLSTQDICLQFHLSPDWVTAHLENIKQKMQVASVEDIAAKATRDGFFQKRAVSV